MAFLILQTAFIGDLILTTPLLMHLARSAPVDVVAIPSTAPLLANHPAVREVIVYDKRGQDRGLRGLFRLAARLRRGHYDAVLLAQGSTRSGALVRLAGIPRRVGFATSAGRRFYTDRVTYDESAHHARRLLALAAPIVDRAAAAEDLQPRLYPGDAERAAVDALLGESDDASRVPPAAARPIIALAPGSVWATKRWPYYPALARELASSARIVVVGGRDDTPLAREIADVAGSAVIDATGQLSLLASAELIGRARVLVTNDSAPQHLASAMGTPTLTVFGPTVPEFGFGPLAPRSAVAGVAGLACRPCDRHGPMRCPLTHWRCMRDLTPEHVHARVRELLSTSNLQYAP